MQARSVGALVPTLLFFPIHSLHLDRCRSSSVEDWNSLTLTPPFHSPIIIIMHCCFSLSRLLLQSHPSSSALSLTLSVEERCRKLKPRFQCLFVLLFVLNSNLNLTFTQASQTVSKGHDKYALHRCKRLNRAKNSLTNLRTGDANQAHSSLTHPFLDTTSTNPLITPLALNVVV